jgi:hypothetical protein
MKICQVIEDLRYSLERITAEDELYGIIADRLTALRKSYPLHRSLFTPNDIEFLKSLHSVSDQLQSFIEIKEELFSIDSIREYEDIVGRLVRAKGALAGFPVAKRIAKEIRDLNEKLPGIREQDKARRQFRIQMRKLDLERNPRRCRSHHPMVIREGSHGYFWGCSRYPFCHHTAQLTTEEEDLLTPA